MTNNKKIEKTLIKHYNSYPSPLRAANELLG